MSTKESPEMLDARSDALVDHIKGMQSVLWMVDRLPECVAVTPTVNELRTSARRRLLDILGAVDAVTFVAPKIGQG